MGTYTITVLPGDGIGPEVIEQAEHVLRTGQADVVVLARQLLRDPYWPLTAARQLGATVRWPPQYERARD